MGRIMQNGIDYTGASVVELTQAEYDALPSSKYSDGITYLIKDRYSANATKMLGVGDCYSTSEKVVGCWIDGKPLYQKTKFSTSNLSYNTLNTVSLGISNVDKFVSVTGFIAYGNDANFIPLPYGDRGNSNVCIAGINTNNGEAKVWIGSDYQSYNVVNLLIITVQYTKTTDVAGSGDWTPSGLPAVHYDDTEQVIGTFFGETLYQKTFNLTSGNTDLTIARDSWTSLGISIPNLKYVINAYGTAGSSGSFQSTILIWNDSGTIKGQTSRNTDYSWVKYLTIQYTKSS